MGRHQAMTGAELFAGLHFVQLADSSSSIVWTAFWGAAFVCGLGLLTLLHLPRTVHNFKMDMQHNRHKFLAVNGFSSWNSVGNLLCLLLNLNRLYDFLLECAEKQIKISRQTGNTEGTSIIMQLPTMRITSSADAAVLEHVLKTNFENYPKGRDMNEPFKDLLGDGIFAVDGHKWKQQRKTASHEFTVDKFRQLYLNIFLKFSACAVSRVDEHDGQAFDVQDLFQRYTLDSIGELGFGVQLGCLESTEPIPFAVAFDGAQEQIWYRTVPDQVLWKVKRLFGLGNERNMSGWIHTLREFTQNVIDNRRREVAREGDNGRSDILSRFISLRDENGKPFTDQYLRDVVLNFVIAGRDTTSNALTWTMHMLTEHPEVEARVRAELAGLPAHPTFDDLNAKRRPYLHATVTEVLRLYPSVPMELKSVLNDDILPDGTFVPGGSFFSFSPYCGGRLTEVWGEDAKS